MDKQVNHQKIHKTKSKKSNTHNSKIIVTNPIKISNQDQQTMILNDAAMSKEQMVLSQNFNQQNIPFQPYQMNTQQISQPVIISNSPEYGVPQMQNIPYINNINNINNVNNVNNVNNPQTIDIRIRLTSRTQEFACPYCHKIMKTNIDERCNCVSFLFYLLLFIIPPLIFIYAILIDITGCYCELECRACQDCCCFYPSCCRCPQREHLDCRCCCDVNHYCPYCGKLIGTRNACDAICPPCCCCGCENQNVVILNDINNNANIDNNINVNN